MWFKIFGCLTQKWFVFCTLTIWYIIYSMVGRSIASISYLSGIFTSALRTSVNMAPCVRYIGYGPPYTIHYIIHICRCVFYCTYPVQVHWCPSTASCPWQCHASGGQGSRQCQPQDILPLLHSWRRIRSASVPSFPVPIGRGTHV